MYCNVKVNNITKKKSWDSDKCQDCEYRFGCFSSNEIHLQPVEFSSSAREFIAKFVFPRCIRIGLFKSLADDGLFSFGGFKHGEVRGKGITMINLVVVKLPNIVTVEGYK